MQDLLTVGRPAQAALALGAEVDSAYSASMIVLGSLSGRWRTVGLARREAAAGLARREAAAEVTRRHPGPSGS